MKIHESSSDNESEEKLNLKRKRTSKKKHPNRHEI